MTVLRLLGTALLGIVVVGGLAVALVDPITLVQYLSYVSVATLLIVRRPGSPIGWLLLVIGLGFLTTTAPTDGASLEAGTADLLTRTRAWLASWGGTASFIGYAALAALFPSGQLPSGRWRRIAQLALGGSVAIVAFMAVAPTMAVSPDGTQDLILDNPFGLLPDAPFWDLLPPGSTSLTLVPVLVVLAASAGSLVIRYRRASGILRLQFRWLVASMAFVVIAVLYGIVISLIFGLDAGWFAWLPAIIAYPTVPVAIGVAVNRYRLFEIDRIVSRSIAYGAVTILLFGLFAIVNLGTQALLGPFVAGNTIGVAISTLIVAAAFNPLRVRLQRLVDRRFNRARYDQERTLEHFAAGLRGNLEVDRVLAHIRSTVEEAVEPRAIGVWRR